MRGVRSMATRFAKSHEWVSLEGNIATLGITDHAANALGDVVHIDMPEIGEAFDKGCVISSADAVLGLG